MKKKNQVKILADNTDPQEWEYHKRIFLVYKSEEALRATGENYVIRAREYQTFEECAQGIIFFGLQEGFSIFESKGLYSWVEFPDRNV